SASRHRLTLLSYLCCLSPSSLEDMPFVPACKLSTTHCCLRVGGQYRPQCGLQRIEPRLVVAPVLDPFAENRLANLLGAGGAHRALVLIEAQARRLERQPAVLQQESYLCLGVLDHRLIEDAMDTAG